MHTTIDADNSVVSFDDSDDTLLELPGSLSSDTDMESVESDKEAIYDEQPDE